MDKCEFCSDIMTAEELDKFDNKLWNEDAFGIFNVLAYRNAQGDVDLVTFSYCDDDFCHGMMEYWFDKEECPLTFEQCTGLKDKNGKLIYEGDILASNNECFREKYKVEFWQQYSQFLLVGINTIGGAFGIVKQNSLEIIGNIHENPELLEGK